MNTLFNHICDKSSYIYFLMKTEPLFTTINNSVNQKKCFWLNIQDQYAYDFEAVRGVNTSNVSLLLNCEENHYYDYLNNLIVFIVLNEHYAIEEVLEGTITRLNPSNRCIQFLLFDVLNDIEVGRYIINNYNITPSETISSNHIVNLFKQLHPYKPEKVYIKNSADVSEKLKQLEIEIFKLQPIAFNIFFKVIKEIHPDRIPFLTIQSMHGVIGGRNNFAPITTTRFASFSHFLTEYEKGFFNYHAQMKTLYDTAIIRIKLYQNDTFRRYWHLYLERNYYRQYKERVRIKPEKIWQEIHFGDNTFMYSMYILPQKPAENMDWSNSQRIQHVSFQYYTLEHLLITGLVHNNVLNHYFSLEDIINLYTTFKNKSSSVYNKKFIDCYIDYISSIENWKNIPILIPEFRYDGKEIKHKYRLDFLILNFNIDYKIGIELSPASTHLNRDGKTASSNWNRESQRNNAFLEKYNLHIITFTDEELKSIENCFSKIKPYLKEETTTMYDASYQQKILDIKLIE